MAWKITTIIMLFVALKSIACGDSLGGVKSGEKTISIELKTEGKQSRFVSDDDGVFALSIVAAYCNADIPYAKVDLTADQMRCSDEEQRKAKIPREEQIVFRYTDKNFQKKEQAIAVIQEKCGFDAVKTWTEANEKVANAPLSCVEKVSGIVKKAVARHAEFVQEQIDDAKPANGKTMAPELKAYLEKQNAEHVYFKKLAEIFSETPVKAGGFKTWLVELEPYVNEHSYSVIDFSKEKIDLGEREDLSSLLNSIGAKLPFTVISMCSEGISSEMIASISSAIWQPLSTRKTTVKRSPKVLK